MRLTVSAVTMIAAGALAAGCAEDTDEGAETAVGAESALGIGGPSPLELLEGGRLFFTETFSGNGRTCGTCHTPLTGTINPQQVEALYRLDPRNPLFRGDGADEPGGNTFDRVRRHATFRVVLPLPPNVSIVGSTAREVAVHRGVPTTMNTPALDPVLMYDGRAPNLVEQARGAIRDHAGSTRVTNRQLELIAGFQKTLFNDVRLVRYAAGGPPPTLPPGRTAAEKRGRIWFTDDNPVNGNPASGRCVHCHSGPMLNETSPGLEALLGVPAGSRFITAFVSELNPGNFSQQTFRFTNPDGTTTDIVSHDPGLALITGDPATAHLFKIPTLWGATKTAPYMHDNSIKDLRALLDHYDEYFNLATATDLTEQDKQDIIAYMKLL